MSVIDRRAELARVVIDIVVRQNAVDRAVLTARTTFEEIGLTSLAAIELLFTVEDTFRVTIPDETAQAVRSVDDMVDALLALGVTPPAATG